MLVFSEHLSQCIKSILTYAFTLPHPFGAEMYPSLVAIHIFNVTFLFFFYLFGYLFCARKFDCKIILKTSVSFIIVHLLYLRKNKVKRCFLFNFVNKILETSYNLQLEYIVLIAFIQTFTPTH